MRISDLFVFSFLSFFCGKMRIADGGGDTIVYLFVYGFARGYMLQSMFPMASVLAYSLFILSVTRHCLDYIHISYDKSLTQ